MNYNQLVASRMKFHREKSRLTVAAVADCLDLQKSTISSLENGKQKINVEHLKAYSELLNIPIMDFLPDIKLRIHDVVLNNEMESQLKENLITTIDYLNRIIGRK